MLIYFLKSAFPNKPKYDLIFFGFFVYVLLNLYNEENEHTLCILLLVDVLLLNCNLSNNTSIKTINLTDENINSKEHFPDIFVKLHKKIEK